MITLYGIPHCDTVKRARAWLAGQGGEVRFHDFKKLGVPADRLDAWMAVCGWQTVLNRRGNTWRQLDTDRQAAVTGPAEARALMLALASVIKRPVVEWPDGAITVGFDAPDWSARLQRGGRDPAP